MEGTKYCHIQSQCSRNKIESINLLRCFSTTFNDFYFTIKLLEFRDAASYKL